MAEKFTLSLTAAEINERLNKIPGSGQDWTSIIDQTFMPDSRRGQSGAAISKYVEDYVTEYVTDSVESATEAINSDITELAQGLEAQVSTISDSLEELNTGFSNLDFNSLQDKPFYSEINYINAQTLIPTQEVSFTPYELNQDLNVARLKFDSELPFVAGGSVTFKIDGSMIADSDIIEYAIDQYEPVFSIGSIELLEEDYDIALADKGYFVCYGPAEDGDGFEVLIALRDLPEETHVVSLAYNTTEIPFTSGNFDVEIIEDDNGNVFAAGVTIAVSGLTPGIDVFNLTFNGKTYSNISFLTPDDLLDDPDLIEELSGIYFIGNPSLVDPAFPSTSDDFFMYTLDGMLVFYTTEVDKLSTLEFTKLLQLSEYVHRLDDKYLAYRETYGGSVVFDGDVLASGNISVKELKKDVEALEAKPELLVEGQFVSSDYSKGLSANRIALPTNNNVWIEGSAGQPYSATRYANGDSYIAGYSYTAAKMQLVDDYFQIRLDFSNNGESNAKSVYDSLEKYRHVKVADELNSYLLTVNSRECNGTTLLFNCSREGVLDFTEERDIKTLIFYPYLGSYSHSEGNNTNAFGHSAHAEGCYTDASGNYSHAEGYLTEASGTASHAEGYDNIATGEYSHAEGYSTEATGSRSHAEGYSTEASGSYSHAEGYDTAASGSYSHAEGYRTEAIGDHTHTEGYYTKAPSGSYAHAEGNFTEASGSSSHAEGDNTKATGEHSHAEGYSTEATGQASHAEGWNTDASGNHSHAEGSFSAAAGEHSHAEGYSTEASGSYSHAEGNDTTASGGCSHAEGYSTEAIGEYSHTEGNNTKANGSSSHAEGSNTEATGWDSHAEGWDTIASGNYSHAEGTYTEASGNGSHAEGGNTIATGDYSHVEGKYNIVDTDKQYAHILGNGTEKKLSNAHTVDWFGNAWFAGSISASNFVNETSGEPLGTSTSNGVVLNDIETDLAYVLQVKNGQLSISMLPEEITISKLPNKLTYIAGERIDLSGVEFLAHYPDGSTKVIEPNSVICDPDPLMDEGDIDVQVKIRFYSTFEAFFSVTVEPFNPELMLIDFTYEVDNTDGTYILTGWNGTLNGVPGTEIVIPDNAFIKL